MKPVRVEPEAKQELAAAALSLLDRIHRARERGSCPRGSSRKTAPRLLGCAPYGTLIGMGEPIDAIETRLGLIHAALKKTTLVKFEHGKEEIGGGRTFAQVWADPTVWISYDPGSAAGRFGATLGKEMALSHYACRIGSWTLVATLIHELAHVNGANGVTHDAEATLQKCLMGQHHVPTIMGQIRSASKLTRIA